MMAQILITKPGTLTKADKTKLRAVDVVVVESDDPSSVKLITPEYGELAGSDLAFAAIKAMVTKGQFESVSDVFAKTLYSLLTERRKPTP